MNEMNKRIVAQVVELVYRGFAACRPRPNRDRLGNAGGSPDWKSAAQQIGDLRYAALAGLVLLTTLLAGAQPYSIDWFTIDGGGGTSTNGQYSISGTIGQPDAGNMSGGNYMLQGGFWGVVAAIQTPGAPLLTITPSGANVIISWPSPSSGSGLQENLDLNPANWSAVPSTNNDNGTIKSITVPARPGNRFYRLMK